MLGLSVFSASFNSILLNKSDASNKDTVFKFNFMCSLVWCVLLFFANGCTVHINSQMLLWGLLYGIAQTCFLLSKTEAMSTGPVSVTTLIGNSSLLVSVFVSMLLWNEAVTYTKAVGLILLCISIFLCTYKGEKGSHEPQWKLYVLLFFVFASMVGLIFKAFGKTGNLEYSGDMLLLSAIIMAVSNFAVCLFTENRAMNRIILRKRLLYFALASGVLSCLYNRLNIFLSGSMDAIIFFPIFNGGTILLSTLLSVFFLKEKLMLKQKIGILTGILSICIIGLF